MKETEVKWPLFRCLSPQAQAKLMQYQWDNHGCRLGIPPLPEDIHIDTTMESTEEIDQLMRQKPRYPRGAKRDG